MRSKIRQITLTVLFLCLCSGVIFANSNKVKEIKPGEIWNDTSGTVINAHGGGILFHDGKYWWFGEHKVAGSIGNTAQVGVHCYSSTDLYNWKDEGIALKVSEDSNSDIVRGSIIERPKVLYNAKTKKFVMWFHLEKKSTGYSNALSGVAVADKIAGPYTFIRSLNPNAGHWPLNVPESDKRLLDESEKADIKARKLGTGYQPNYPKNILYRQYFKDGQQARDMTLFQDDNGKAYHIYSSELNGVLHIAELSEDYQGHSGRYVRAFPGRFYEAPAIFKRNGKYYLFGSDCTGWAPNAARMAVADNIFGPWKELGNPCHGSDEQKNKTFYSQSTFVLPVPEKNTWIFMADRWCPKNAIDGRYIWLPIQFDDNGIPYLQWFDHWKFD